MRSEKTLKRLVGTVTVNVTGSTPNGLFPGTDTSDVGSQTIVLGNSSSTLFGTPGSVPAPPGVLADFPQASSTSK